MFFFSDEINLKDKAQDSSLVGPDELIAYRAKYYRAFPDMKMALLSVSPLQGDTVTKCDDRTGST